MSIILCLRLRWALKAKETATHLVKLIITLIYSCFKKSKTIFLATGDYHDINGTTYYIDSALTYRLGDAKYMCYSLNMEIIDFISAEKWPNIVAWLKASGDGK
jgi:hypothetical protein